jgi:hypothetical protein
LTQTERGKTISFFNELDIEIRTMLVTSVSFFNEVATEMQKLSSETSVSFFNEVAAEMQKLSSKI